MHPLRRRRIGPTVPRTCRRCWSGPCAPSATRRGTTSTRIARRGPTFRSSTRSRRPTPPPRSGAPCWRSGPPDPPRGLPLVGRPVHYDLQGRHRGKGENEMTYTICEPCIDVKDKACVDECPVDCIYEGPRMLYIHPD